MGGKSYINAFKEIYNYNFYYSKYMGLPLKAPKLSLKKKTFGIPNTLVYPAWLVAVGIGGYYLWQTYGSSLNLPKLEWLFGGQPKPEVPKAVRVNFNVYPPVVKPFRKLRLQGQFEDMNGMVANVAYGYYSIFESVPAGQSFQKRLLVSSGIVGQNVGAFRQDIPTDNFRTGPYTVYISNRPIREDPGAGPEVFQQLTGRQPFTIG